MPCRSCHSNFCLHGFKLAVEGSHGVDMNRDLARVPMHSQHISEIVLK